MDTKQLDDLSKAINEASKPLNDFALAMAEAAEEIIKAFAKIGDALSNIIPPNIERAMMQAVLMRREGESLVAWAERIEASGYWDDPEFRWMYQRECLGAIFLSPVRAWKRWRASDE